MTVKELKESLMKYDDNLEIDVIYEGAIIGKVILLDGDKEEVHIEVREDS